MTITYWTNFSKRKNSTKRPTSGTDATVTLKQPTSIESPEFTLTDANAANITYFKIGDHYYFVADTIRLTNDTVRVIGRQDVLATYKSAIGSTTALIARSSSNYNKYLRDEMVSTFTTKTSDQHAALSMPFSSTGCYIVSVVNKIASASGYVCTYIMNASTMESLALWLSGDGTYSGDPWTTIQSELIMQFGDCFDCIRGVKWIPVDYSTASAAGTAENVYVGKFYTGFNAYKVSNTTPLVDSATIDLTDIIPDDFRAASPYSTVDVYIPFYGLVPIPGEYCTSSIGVDYHIDLTACDCHVAIYTTDSKILASIHYELGIDTPIAQIGRTAVAVTQSALGVAASALSLNPIGMASAGLGLISSVASNGVSQKGSIGGRSMAHWPNIFAVGTVSGTTLPDDLTAVMGRPCMEVLQISSLSGYVQCINASVALNGRDADRDEVNSYLNSGFFYE